MKMDTRILGHAVCGKFEGNGTFAHFHYLSAGFSDDLLAFLLVTLSNIEYTRVALLEWERPDPTINGFDPLQNTDLEKIKAF